MTGKTTSEKMTVHQGTLGTSPDSFADGCPSLFFLWPVIMVHDRRQKPIHELLCEWEFPLDIDLKNSL